MPECPNCERQFRGRTCHICQWSAEGDHSTRPPRSVCDCGARLLTSGTCAATGGYPATAACSIACPMCRGPLAWDGGCERCHGCLTGRREDWTFPGDRYELEAGHWRRTEGPRRACSLEETAAGFAILRARLGRILAADEP